MRSLELKIPPPIVLLLFILLAYLGNQWLPSLPFPLLVTQFYWLIAGIGISIAFIGVWQFRRTKTTITPLRPDKTNELVTSGIYRISRNPMYLGMLLVLLAAVFKLGNVFGLVTLPCFMLYITHFQIKPEENMIQRLFSEEYRAYKNKVRRWI